MTNYRIDWHAWAKRADGTFGNVFIVVSGQKTRHGRFDTMQAAEAWIAVH